MKRYIEAQIILMLWNRFHDDNIKVFDEYAKVFDGDMKTFDENMHERIWWT